MARIDLAHTCAVEGVGGRDGVGNSQVHLLRQIHGGSIDGAIAIGGWGAQRIECGQHNDGNGDQGALGAVHHHFVNDGLGEQGQTQGQQLQQQTGPQHVAPDFAVFEQLWHKPFEVKGRVCLGAAQGWLVGVLRVGRDPGDFCGIGLHQQAELWLGVHQQDQGLVRRPVRWRVDPSVWPQSPEPRPEQLVKWMKLEKLPRQLNQCWPMPDGWCWCGRCGSLSLRPTPCKHV